MAEEQISVVLKANIDNYNKNMSIAAGVLKDLQKQSAAFMKINTGVEDSFTKIDFAAKKFGETAGVLEKKLIVVKKAMTDLVVAGQENTKAFKELDNQYKIITNRLENKAMAEAQAYAQSNMTNMLLPKTAKGLEQAGHSIKKSNMQWTNLALVIQDLPYGFRGIQNNLPALLGSFAGVTGAIYLATSVVIAFFTAWDNGMISFGKSSKMAADYAKATATAYSTEIVKLKALYSITTDANRSMNDRITAAKTLKEEYPGLLSSYSNEEIALGKAKTAYDTLTKAILFNARSKAAQEQVTKIEAERLPLLIERTELLAKEREHSAKGLTFVNQRTGEVMKTTSTYTTALQKNAKAQIELNKKAAPYVKIVEDYILAEEKLTKIKEAPDAIKSTKDSYLLDSLKAKQQAYKDDIYEFRKYGILIINEEERLAVIRAKADGTYQKNKKDLHDRYDADRLTNNNLFEQNLNKVLDDNAKIRTAQEKKELEIQAANRKMIADGILAINKQFAEDDLKNAILFAKNQTKAIETELGVQDKLNRNSLTNRIQFTEEALAKLVVLAAFTFDPEVLAVYLNAIDSINAKLKGMGETWDATSQKIKNILENVMADSISKFAENIGKGLAGDKVDLFGGIAETIADGAIAIGKALIAYGVAIKAFKLAKTNPVLAIIAGAGLVVAGSFLKAKMSQSNKGGGESPTPFANGGVISGPTMGLMGEYPGARSNPEIVAPLDKLKNLIGGSGGGTLEARISGNDLLILMNKAQRNNNLSF